MKIKSGVAGKCLLLLFANWLIAMNVERRRIYLKDYRIHPYSKEIEYMKNGFLFTVKGFYLYEREPIVIYKNPIKPFFI